MPPAKGKKSAPKTRYRAKTVPEFQEYIRACRKSLTLMKKKTTSKRMKDILGDNGPKSSDFKDASAMLTSLQNMYKSLCKTPARAGRGSSSSQGFNQPLWVDLNFVELLEEETGISMIGDLTLGGKDDQFVTFNRALVTSCMTLMNRTGGRRVVDRKVEYTKTAMVKGEKTKVQAFKTVKKYVYAKGTAQYKMFQPHTNKELDKGFAVSDVSKFTNYFIHDGIPVVLLDDVMDSIKQNLAAIAADVRAANQELKAQEEAEEKASVLERKEERQRKARENAEKKFAIMAAKLDAEKRGEKYVDESKKLAAKGKKVRGGRR